MKALQRKALSKKAKSVLARRTKQVADSHDQVSSARALWRNQKNKTFREVRSVLEGMATGRSRCMYCEDSQGTDIDHFWPKATYPLKAFVWENYLLACGLCNSNYKRTQFPVDVGGNPRLLDPTVDDPALHLVAAFDTGLFVEISAKGKSSIDVFQLNRDLLAKGRRDTFVVLCALISDYASARDAGQDEWAGRIAEALRGLSFASVFSYLVRGLGAPGATSILPPEVIDAFARYPALREPLTLP